VVLAPTLRVNRWTHLYALPHVRAKAAQMLTNVAILTECAELVTNFALILNLMKRKKGRRLFIVFILNGCNAATLSRTIQLQTTLTVLVSHTNMEAIPGAVSEKLLNKNLAGVR